VAQSRSKIKGNHSPGFAFANKKAARNDTSGSILRSNEPEIALFPATQKRQPGEKMLPIPHVRQLQSESSRLDGLDHRRRLGAEAIHLCIDMQRLFSPDGIWPTPWMTRVLPSVIELVEHAECTVFTRFLTPHSPLEMPGMWRAYYQKWSQATREHLDERLLDLMPDLQRFAPPAAVFDKLMYSAFSAAMKLFKVCRLDRRLRFRSVWCLLRHDSCMAGYFFTRRAHWNSACTGA
jgi:isochorismatase family protein